MKATFKLQLGKDTAKTHVFKTEEDVSVNSLYVKKTQFPKGAPKELTVTLEWKD